MCPGVVHMCRNMCPVMLSLVLGPWLSLRTVSVLGPGLGLEGLVLGRGLGLELQIPVNITVWWTCAATCVRVSRPS